MNPKRHIGMAVLISLCLPMKIDAQDSPKTVPAVDGVFDEWKDEYIVARDAVGDATGAFDIKTVWARSDEKMLYLAFELDKPLNLQNGIPADGTLKLHLAARRVEIPVPLFQRCTIDFRRRTIELEFWEERLPKARPDEAQPIRWFDNKQVLSWADSEFSCLPTYASSKFELKIKRRFGGRVSFSGSDLIDEFKITNNISGIRRPKTNAYDPVTGSDFRIASLNTLRNGLGDPERGPAMKRLLAAAKASIYCFQEEFEEALYRAALPAAFEEQVNTVWAGGCSIATRFDLTPLPMKLEGGVAGLVKLPNGKFVAVISAHFECCGFVDSAQDRLRVQQAEQLVGEIKRMRDGAFGVDAKVAPLVLIGDYNLVGSRKPLDQLRAAGLKDVLLRFPNDGSAYTWRGLTAEESFWPGRLDLLTHSDDLTPLKALVLDTERLKPWQLRELGWPKKNDSRASDHLMLIGDFRIESAVKSSNQ